MDITWKGPYSWPGYEEENNLKPVPKMPGVYLQTFEYNGGYIIYAVGLTRRPVPTRLKEHTQHFMEGEYNVLELEAVQKGFRKEIWHGWDYAKTHRNEFEARKEEILKAIHTKLQGMRIFITALIDLDPEARILERLEAGVMNTLYAQPSPIGDIPDKGMHLSPRWETEEPILVQNKASVALHGLPDVMEI